MISLDKQTESRQIYGTAMLKNYIKKNFDEVIEFFGSLSDGDHTVGDLQFIVSFSKIKPGRISGKIIGDTDTSRLLVSLMNSKKTYLKLISKWENTERYSEKVIIHSFSGRYLFGGLKGASEVANFELYDFNDIYYFEKPHELNERHLTYYLAGVKDIFDVWAMQIPSVNGTTQNKIKGLKLNIDERVSAEITPWYFYEQSHEDPEIELSTKVLILDFSTSLTKEEFQDNEFLQFGEKASNDLLILYSFLVGQWIVWYSYILETNDRVHSFYRHTRDVTSTKIYRDSIPIKWSDISDFIHSSYKQLNLVRQQGFDLDKVISYYITGSLEKYLETQFTTTFLALEKIKADYESINNLGKTLSSNEFEKLKKFISSSISQFTDNKNAESDICSKIPELNRPPIRTTIEKIFQFYSIEWKDLYPEGSDLTIFNTRNKLFHSAKNIDFNYLSKEMERLQILLTRMILKILGWNDLSNTMQSYQSYLREL